MNYIEDFTYIINTPMKLIEKKELLLQLILKLDAHDDKIFRKHLIVKIQNILDILDKIK